MNTKLLWILIVIVVVLLGAWFAFGRTMPAPETPNDMAATTTDQVLVPPTEPQTVTVTYGATGFTPASVTVNVGDTVRFVNESDTDMWVASDEHPTHTDYDGTSTREHCVDGAATGGAFDECARTGQGTSWSYTFTKAGTFEYHNHARAADGGTVVVD